MSASLVRLAEAVSTQDEVHRLATEGAPAGTAVVARSQRAGRGSRGRDWQSPEGGLWLSVLWRGSQEASSLLSLRAGLAVADLLDGIGGLPSIELKWPNDVIIADTKVGGILCEGRWGGTNSWVAIGVGLNVTNPVPADARFPAAALSQWRPDIDAASLAAPLASALGRLAGSAVLSDDERAAWHHRDWLVGRRLRAPVAGVVAGISPLGRLLIDAESGRRELVASDGIEL